MSLPALARLGKVPFLGLAAALASCGQSIDLPQQDTPVVLRAALVTLAACSRPPDADGNIDETALRAFGWRPQSRRLGEIVTRGDTTGMEERPLPPDRPARLASADQSETSEWTHPAWQGRLDLSRTGGSTPEPSMRQCSASYHGRDAATAELALAAMTLRLGAPERRGERSPGGDWLTPRWFEPTIHEAYWRLPTHDVYWVSTDLRLVTVEVRAAANRDGGGQPPTDPSAAGNQAEENGL